MQSTARAYHSHRLYAERWHPHNALLQDALDDTVTYIKANMADAIVCGDAYDVLDLASARVELDGLILEFGVRTGTSINHIAHLHPDRAIHGFDSFEGLPEDWSGSTSPKGTFAGEGRPTVAPNVELVIGWFDDTLGPFLDNHPGDAALVHIDSDLYSSAKTVLDELAPRIVPGSVIVFNEYFNYPNWRAHEFKAWQEFCADRGLGYRYLCWGMYEVAVKVTAIGD
ncbi:MAG: TylF/MycF family methyltransferase [Acidimicrobiia bacterium]|nr:TylF/MycF family methyltransferase [Acidimicrobiia bacterium]